MVQIYKVDGTDTVKDGADIALTMQVYLPAIVQIETSPKYMTQILTHGKNQFSPNRMNATIYNAIKIAERNIEKHA
jgi:hypothetical protein